MTATPPYQAIADGIRDQIAAGRLRPGDRVPSARQLTRDWNVAIATATKALNTLRQAGLTEVRPGVGTVVAVGPTKEPVPRGNGDLTRDRIVATAVEIAGTEGMAEVSMRRIATRLGVATMSLYRHVPTKDDLLLHMVDRVLGEHPLPAEPPAGWRARIEVSTRAMWAAFKRHPWLATTMSLNRPQLVPNALPYLEWVIGAFDDEDVSGSDRLFIHVMVFGFTRGIASALESEVEAERETGLTQDEFMEGRLWDYEPWRSSAAVHLMASDEIDFDLDQLFEFGLARLLDGIAVFLDRGTPNRP